DRVVRAPTHAEREALERLWRSLPAEAKRQVGGRGALDEEVAKTIEWVANRTYVLVQFLHQAAWARGMWGEQYGTLEGKIAGGCW
ncbi:MAG: hypothetical protein LQ347_006743, partial [Umbilicaria vellea]